MLERLTSNKMGTLEKDAVEAAVLVKPGLRLPGPVRIGDFTRQGLESRVKKLASYVEGGRGGRVDSATKERTVRVLIDSARGKPEERIRDLEFLGELGVRFTPMHHYSGKLTMDDACSAWGVDSRNIAQWLENRDVKSGLGVETTEIGPVTIRTRWSIPAETVNRVNDRLKTLIPLHVLFEHLKERGVFFSDTEKFNDVFRHPKIMGRVYDNLREAVGGRDLFIGSRLTPHMRFTDVSTAAAVARFVLEEKRMVDEVLEGTKIHEVLNISEQDFVTLYRYGKLPARLSSVMGKKAPAVRATLAHIARAMVSWGDEDRAVTLLKAVDVSKVGRYTVVELPPGIEAGQRRVCESTISRHGSPHLVPDGGWKMLERYGVAFRVLGGDEAKRWEVREILLEMYGDDTLIRKNVSTKGLTELGYTKKETTTL